jgi:DNA repair protein RecO (recombination protein O)
MAIDWRENGTLLAVRRHGENAAIVEVFTRDQGRHAGIVRGGTSRRLAPHLQPGAVLDLHWRARLEDHLGSFAVEPLRARAPAILGDKLALAGLNAVTGLLAFALPERAPHPDLFDRSEALLDTLGAPDWPHGYLLWELALLEEMGHALDLSVCAVSGMTEGLAYVSPRTGRAVSRIGAGDWSDRLLPLPPCLLGGVPEDTSEILAGLRTTGHFLKTQLAHHLSRPLPPGRERFVVALSRR